LVLPHRDADEDGCIAANPQFWARARRGQGVFGLLGLHRLLAGTANPALMPVEDKEQLLGERGGR